MATREATPPPVIGKAGRYTVFITPPATPRPSETTRSENPSPSPKFTPRDVGSLPSESSRFLSSSPREKMRSSLSAKEEGCSPVKGAEKPPFFAPPPVQVPPPQFEKIKGGQPTGSFFGIFWDAVAKVQNANSSLDQYLADWLGLDQSKYQWALNEYYENNAGKDGVKQKELVSKGQAV